ncbi:hypothetical protein [Lacticaseibacillus kribbianus]|uniref:hypothetical protein n=1 Tax=Lacticaseibacillus kribbianus TaxID=2926292 RepID=UPI001CD4AC7D|nr:hypothetical protein [Lacticaseibacillus kribbianus]
MKKRALFLILIAMSTGAMALSLHTQTVRASSDTISTDINQPATQYAVTPEETVDHSSLKELGFNHFEITEDGKTYDQEFYPAYDTVSVNGTYYQLGQYYDVLAKSDGTLTDSLKHLTPMINQNQQVTNLTLSRRTALPTTGYSSLIYIKTHKKYDMKMILSSAAEGAVGVFLGGGVGVAKVLIKNALKAAVAGGLIESVKQSFTTTAYYKQYQAYHKTVYGAVKEQRKPFVKVYGKTVYGSAYTYYFWSVRPQS